MLGSSDLIAFVASTDLARSRAFYEGLLNLTVVEQNDFACVIAAHGTMLRVTVVPDVATPGYTVLGWRVTDMDATIARLSEAGVVFIRHTGLAQQDNGVWATPGGDKVAWFTDPDGNTLSLTEFS
ncbi:VOC family protein [Acidothermaceae bacterium B102]|nr:VOC family protein [Acidothermaceae bacterium B102]